MSTACSVCGDVTEAVIDLPRLPLAGIFVPPGEQVPEAPVIDQTLMHCATCGHAQLGRPLAASALYGEHYNFRTSASHSARDGTAFFLRFIDRIAGGRTFQHVLDVGCNDLHLLRSMGGRAQSRTGIDPVWAGKDGIIEGISVLGATVEEIDLGSLDGGAVDLVVCRHTLEHIANPRSVVRTLVEATAPGGLLFFEVPGFDRLLGRLRFDQIFHDHLQYFSRASFFRLLRETGAEYVAHTEHPQHWGALLVAFRPGRATSHPAVPPPSRDRIASAYAAFAALASATRGLVEAAEPPVFGYGAAHLLPNLAYHLNGLEPIEVILDDDAGRDGWRYPGLQVVIRTPGSVERWQDGTVVVTALDAMEPILRRLLASRPRDIIMPLSQF